MRASFFAAVFLASLGAQAKDETSTTIGIFSPSWSDGNVLGYATSAAASVAGINADATTYHVGCMKNAPKTECDIPTSWTIIQGPETVNFAAKYIVTESGKEGKDLTVTETYDCSLKSWTESASCSMSISGGGSMNGGKTSSSASSKITYSTGTSSYYKLTVTGGVESFTAPEATKTPDAAAAGPAGALITAGPVVAAVMVALL